MKTALVELQDRTMRVNRMNIEAMLLLKQDRDFEAIDLLKQTLALDPQNPFTLNNLGVASESVSDLDAALRYYQEAAAGQSKEPAAITLDKSWRGKSVTNMARTSARMLQKRMEGGDATETKAVMYTLRGVHEENANNWTAAREDFLHAYALDPTSAFSLNNRGYIAEREGDLETAQYFYEKAGRADNSNAKIGLATKLYARGQALSVVASDSNEKVDTALDIYSQQRKRQGAPIELTPRGGTPEPTPEIKPDENPGANPVPNPNEQPNERPNEQQTPQ
jgi:tetratricopeptide (TPR) repeat protein